MTQHYWHKSPRLVWKNKLPDTPGQYWMRVNKGQARVVSLLAPIPSKGEGGEWISVIDRLPVGFISLELPLAKSIEFSSHPVPEPEEPIDGMDL